MIEVIKINGKKDLETAWAIRKEVFVREQHCPEEIEWEYENESNHFLAFYDGEPCGTARWRITNEGIKLERFAVLRNFRNKKVGAYLLKAVLADIPRDAASIYLHAQLTAKNFYLRHAFVPVGPNFWEAGIEHVKMALEPALNMDCW